MRNLLVAAFVLALAPACTDDNDIVVVDDADAADADGLFLGSRHARNVDVDLAGHADLAVLAKSAAILIAIDENEIVLADFALARALDPVVLAYAQLVIDDHQDHLVSLDDLLLDFGAFAIENSTSDALRAESAGVLRALQIARDVDYEYTRSQIVMHAEALPIVETLAALSPFVRLAQFLDDTIVEIDAQHDEAELILRGL